MSKCSQQSGYTWSDIHTMGLAKFTGLKLGRKIYYEACSYVEYHKP